MRLNVKLESAYHNKFYLGILVGKKFILDGYNVIGKILDLNKIKTEKSLKSSREALALLVSNIKYKQPGNEFIIVFDGRAGELFGSSTVYLHGVKCYFTEKGVEADDYIGDMLRSMKNTTNIIVVSEDGKVANKCKVYGALVQHPDTLRKDVKRKETSKNIDNKSLSRQSMDEVTRWYMDKLKCK